VCVDELGVLPCTTTSARRGWGHTVIVNKTTYTHGTADGLTQAGAG
jgi:hypothetical protein